MRDYVIITDSSCDLPEDLVRQWDLTVVPLSVEIGSDRFYNTPEEAPDGHTFYSRLVKGEPVKTSAPNVEEFTASMRPILLDGKDILNLSFSSALSATYQNACIAAEELKEEFPDSTAELLDKEALSLNVFITNYTRSLVESRTMPANHQKKIIRAYMDASYSNPLFNDNDTEMVLAYFNDANSLTRFSLDTDWRRAVLAAKAALEKIK